MGSASDIDIVRDYVGTDDPSDGDISALIDSLTSPLLAPQRILRRRLADFEAESASLSVTGISYNTSAKITAIEKKLSALDVAIGGDTGDGTEATYTGFLTSADRLRR